jgi:hypothetical protein
MKYEYWHRSITTSSNFLLLVPEYNTMVKLEMRMSVIACTSIIKVYGIEQPDVHLPESSLNGPQSEQLLSPARDIQ